MITFMVAYFSSMIFSAIEARTFFQELPLIVLFFIVFFSIKTYFNFFQAFQNFNKVSFLFILNLIS